MKNMYLVGLSVLLSMSVACAAETDRPVPADNGGVKPAPNPNPGPEPAPPPDPVCLSLGGPIGLPNPGIGLANPASVYCQSLGYTAEGETCTFPDGTRCEQWSFFRGECGQAHSFCNRHGGEIHASAGRAVCALPSGASCSEQDFAATCSCE
jgi:putative hemolysin